ncbi:MAG: helix-turn-helix transcriptional regulator [Lachnospiraceae bacterium]|nr:helix-turn-helix transcriptional regulator [Lachnospiraceae bacterium]
MNKPRKYHFSALPARENSEKTLYEEREYGITHLPFEVELRLCGAIRRGDREEMKKIADATLSQTISAGRLSDNELLQTKYWCVTVIATSIHYAILGGLDETDAYNLSDSYIRDIDALKEPDACIDYLRAKAFELVDAVNSAKNRLSVSPAVRQALHYVHVHLHERITIEKLASAAGLSRDYFCELFLKETGCTPHGYVTEEKLKEAEKLLSEGLCAREVAYILSYSSQSHFTEVFKKHYGVTPTKYRMGQP